MVAAFRFCTSPKHRRANYLHEIRRLADRVRIRLGSVSRVNNARLKRDAGFRYGLPRTNFPIAPLRRLSRRPHHAADWSLIEREFALRGVA